MNDLKERNVWKNGDIILDVGCGNGRCAIPLVDMNIKYIGLDVIPECIRFCNMAFAQWPQFKFEMLEARNSRYRPQGILSPQEVVFPVADKTVDTVLALSLFTHFETIEACAHYLAEMKRVLKPGGLLWCTWFRSPPNAPCDSADRTVFAESRIIELVKPFELLHSEGGLTPEYHDQWKLLLKKP